MVTITCGLNARTIVITSFSNESEVVRTREVLMRTIEPAGGEQLLRADDAECFAELVADEILPAVAARE
jgi:hypothetical protein